MLHAGARLHRMVEGWEYSLAVAGLQLVIIGQDECAEANLGDDIKDAVQVGLRASHDVRIRHKVCRGPPLPGGILAISWQQHSANNMKPALCRAHAHHTETRLERQAVTFRCAWVKAQP